MSVSRETGSCSAHGDRAHVSRETGRRSPFAAALLAPIRLYGRFLSPALPARCRYYPTCSAYAEDAIRELGPVRGTILAAWRLLRCNPFSKGGLDPVSERPIFRAAGDSDQPAPACDPEAASR